MPESTNLPDRVARSPSQMRVNVAALTLTYQGDDHSGEKHYASVPVSSRYEDVLQNARQCFEGYLPEDLNAYKLELKHEISEGRWATIHPGAFANLVEISQVGEFKLNVRLLKRDSKESRSHTVLKTNHTRTTSTTPNASASAPLIQALGTDAILISNPHHEAFCSRCSTMISGVRYRCTTCNDFDYCGVCIGFAPFEHGHRFDAIINGRTRVYRSSDAWRATGQALPPGVHADDQHKARCDICRTYPIVGTRFKCAECPDWDSCQDCLERSSQFHPEHTFIRVTNQGVLMRRGTAPLRSVGSKHRCSRCSEVIRGSTFFKCNVRSCSLSYLCANCEGLPLARYNPNSCQHPLLKFYA